MRRRRTLIALSHLGLRADRELAARGAADRSDSRRAQSRHAPRRPIRRRRADRSRRPVRRVRLAHRTCAATPGGRSAIEALRACSRCLARRDAPRCSSLPTGTAKRRSPQRSRASVAALGGVALARSFSARRRGRRRASRLRRSGPRRTMPSGGLVAMGNVRNLRARSARRASRGCSHVSAFLRGAARATTRVVAVGDVVRAGIGLLAARAPRLRRHRQERLRRAVRTRSNGPAASRFARVRARSRRRRASCCDTASRPKRRATSSSILLAGAAASTGAGRAMDRALARQPRTRVRRRFAGWRRSCRRRLGERRPGRCERPLDRSRARLGALRARSAGDGWELSSRPQRRSLHRAQAGRRLDRAVDRPGAQLDDGASQLAVGQAGTANEAAAAAGLPIVALGDAGPRRSRLVPHAPAPAARRARLLLVPGRSAAAAAGPCAAWKIPGRLAVMGACGR